MRVQKGFSIVELMVALLLGSLITLAATQLFLVNRQTENLQGGVASIQDQGRFIFDYLSRDLMQAGHSSVTAIEPFVFSGHGGQVGTDGDRYDVLVLNVEDGMDCLGGTGFTGIKKYHVNPATKGLICAEYINDAGTWTAVNANSESLIDNVEAFQVLYGLDSDALGDTGYGEADIYVTSSHAESTDYRIVSVRFAILLGSDRPVGADKTLAPETISVLDRSIGADSGVALDDGRIFRVFASTVSLRNQMDEG